MNKIFLLLILVASQLSGSVASASPGGSVKLEGGRLKIQFSIQKNESIGSFQLRSILEQHGFPDQEGFVRTGAALAPLEIYNYLYETGRYVFTLYLPTDGEKFFVSFDKRGFVSFGGLAAQKLFELLRLYIPQNDVVALEQYKWTDHSYCDRSKTNPIAYRCLIEM